MVRHLPFRTVQAPFVTFYYYSYSEAILVMRKYCFQKGTRSVSEGFSEGKFLPLQYFLTLLISSPHLLKSTSTSMLKFGSPPSISGMSNDLSMAFLYAK
jgi:hypothetical protein